MVQLVSYGFTTVENPLSDAGNFSALNDTFWGSAAMQVPSSGICESTALNLGSGFWSGNVVQTGGVFPADQYGEITLATIGTGGQGNNFPIFLRIAGATTGTYYFAQIATGGAYNIHAVVANTNHTLASGTGLTIAANDVWRFAVVGNVLTLYRNGVSQATFTDTNNYVTGAGAVGFSAYSNTAIADAQISLFAAGGNQAATPTFSPNGGSLAPRKRLRSRRQHPEARFIIRLTVRRQRTHRHRFRMVGRYPFHQQLR